MKKISTYLLISFVAILSSCKKDNNTGGNGGGTGIVNVTKVSPDNFNYSTTTQVSINLTLKTTDNTPIKGVVVNVFLPDSAISKTAIFKGVTDVNGKVTGIVTIPTQYKQLIIYPNYIGLINRAVANINGNNINAVIGGNFGYSGDIVPSGINSMPTKGPNTSNNLTQDASFTNYIYQPPYQYSNAFTSPISNGVPVYLDNQNTVISSTALSYINASLPSNSSVSDLHPQYLSSSAVNVINVTQNTDLYVTFVSEGSSNLNTLGWYSYPTNNPPTAALGGTNSNAIDKVTYVFPNASASGSGGGLVSGNRVKIGTFSAGTTVAFCIIQAGWAYYTSNGSNIYYVNANSTKFYSQDGFNPETTATLKRHQVMLYDDVNKSFVYGVEDVNRTSGQGSDNNFNDLVFMVNSYSPGTATLSNSVSTSGVQSIDKGGDSDGDGVPDTQDAFPNDPTRAYVNYWPSSTTYGTFAFEDNWPTKGDYDMNDLVVGWQYAFSLNAQNQMVDMTANFNVLAAGASFKDGFGLQIPISSAQVSSVTGQKLISNYINLASNGVEAGQTYATVIPFDNYNAVINNPNGAFFINTVPGMPKVTATPISVKITFTSPLAPITVVNPFLISNLKRGNEIHFAGFAPTDLANKTLFGTGDDTSNPATNRLYLSAENRPWAMYFYGPFQYPVERADITNTYLHFSDWAFGGGTSFTDWYNNLSSGYRNNTNIYTQ